MKRLTVGITAACLAITCMAFPPTSARAATSNVTVDCGAVVAFSETFAVSPGDQIVFDVASCMTLFTAAAAPSPLTNPVMQALIDQIADVTGTGGTATADVTAQTVTYVAGSGFGTDTLVVSQAMDGRRLTLSRQLRPRTVVLRQAFSMTRARSSGTPAPPPPTYHTLKLRGTESSQPQCWNTELTAVSGSRVDLPPAAQCIRVGANVPAGSTLLGWATDPAFPSVIAQRHIDNGWGTFDGDVAGTRMIFIPAGQAAVLTGDNTLYAIWNR